MKNRAADPKKYIAGWVISGLAVAVGVYCYFRDHREGLWLAPFVLFFGLGFTLEAKERKEEPPDLPGLRWYHVAAVTVLMALGVFWLYKNFT